MSNSAQTPLGRTRQNDAQRSKQQPARDHPDRALVQDREPPEVRAVVCGGNELPAEEDGVENADERAAGDEAGAEERARADLRFLRDAGPALDEPSYQAAGEDGR